MSCFTSYEWPIYDIVSAVPLPYAHTVIMDKVAQNISIVLWECDGGE